MKISSPSIPPEKLKEFLHDKKDFATHKVWLAATYTTTEAQLQGITLTLQHINQQWGTISDLPDFLTRLRALMIYLTDQFTSRLATVASKQKSSHNSIYSAITLIRELQIAIKKAKNFPSFKEKTPELSLAALLSHLNTIATLMDRDDLDDFLTLSDLYKLFLLSYDTGLLSTTQLCSTIEASGLLAQNGYVCKEQTIFKLIEILEKDLSSLDEAAIAASMLGLSLLAKHSLLTLPLKPPFINRILDQFIHAPLADDNLIAKLIRGLRELTEQYMIENLDLIHADKIIKLLDQCTHVKSQATVLVQVTEDIASIVDCLYEPPSSLSMTLVCKVLTTLSAILNKTDHLTDPDFERYIGKMLLNIGKMVRDNQITADIKTTELSIVDVLIKQLADHAKSEHAPQGLIRAMVYTLESCFLFGRTESTMETRAIAKKVREFLVANAVETKEEWYGRLVSQFEFYHYFIQKTDDISKKEKKQEDDLNNIIKTVLTANKPALPKPDSLHDQLVTQLMTKGCVTVEAEKLFGPYPVDIYAEVKIKEHLVRGIVEIDGPFHKAGKDAAKTKALLRKGVVDFVAHFDLMQRQWQAKEMADAFVKQATQVIEQRENPQPVMKKIPLTPTVTKAIKKDLVEEIILTPVVKLPQMSSPKEKKKTKPTIDETSSTPQDTRPVAYQLITQAQAGNSSAIKQLLDAGIPNNPYTQKPDSYTIILALMSAQLKLQNLDTSTEKQKLHSVIQLLVERSSKEALTEEKQALSPLILAIKNKDKDSDAYQIVYKKIFSSKAKSKHHKRRQKDKVISPTEILGIATAKADTLKEIILDPQQLLKLNSLPIEKKQVISSSVQIKEDKPVAIDEPMPMQKDNNLFSGRTDFNLVPLLRRAKQGISIAQYALSIFYDQNIKKNLELSNYWLICAAEKGLPQAQFCLGVQYLIGKDSLSWATGIEWLTKAANQGHAKAKTYLGSNYASGMKVARDDKQAFKWFKKAAIQKEPLGQYCLGSCYEQGKGVAQDFKKSLEWFKKSAKQGDANAQTHLGLKYIQGNEIKKDEKKAVKWFKKAALQEEPMAQYNLGICCEYGDGTKKNLNRAVKWYKKSADQGIAPAQYNLAVLYEQSKDLAKDFKQAFKWYQKAAMQGYTAAQFNLGLCYQDGVGIKQDLNQAIIWKEKAANQGMLKAQINLALHYKNTKDFEQSFKWFEKAALQGDPFAQTNLGIYYQTGLGGITQDLKQGFEWYLKAATSGFSQAQTHLALCYINGKGVTYDPTQAFEWLKEAAKQKDVNAYYNLGILYLYGMGIDENKTKALAWLKLAAEQGNKRAQDTIKEEFPSQSSLDTQAHLAARKHGGSPLHSRTASSAGSSSKNETPVIVKAHANPTKR